MHACSREFGAGVRYPFVSPGQGFPEAGELQGRDLVATGGFYRLEGRDRGAQDLTSISWSP
jgi:hypothetical protein